MVETAADGPLALYVGFINRNDVLDQAVRAIAEARRQARRARSWRSWAMGPDARRSRPRSSGWR
jgi:hypothetical protein